MHDFPEFHSAAATHSGSTTPDSPNDAYACLYQSEFFISEVGKIGFSQTPCSEWKHFATDQSIAGVNLLKSTPRISFLNFFGFFAKQRHFFALAQNSNDHDFGMLREKPNSIMRTDFFPLSSENRYELYIPGMLQNIYSELGGASSMLKKVKCAPDTLVKQVISWEKSSLAEQPIDHIVTYVEYYQGREISLSSILMLKAEGEFVIKHTDMRSLKLIIEVFIETLFRKITTSALIPQVLLRKVAELVWYLSQATLCCRGSASITEMICFSLLLYHGVVPKKYKGPTIDLDALTLTKKSFTRIFIERLEWAHLTDLQTQTKEKYKFILRDLAKALEGLC